MEYLERCVWTVFLVRDLFIYLTTYLFVYLFVHYIILTFIFIWHSLLRTNALKYDPKTLWNIWKSACGQFSWSKIKHGHSRGDSEKFPLKKHNFTLTTSFIKNGYFLLYGNKSCIKFWMQFHALNPAWQASIFYRYNVYIRSIYGTFPVISIKIFL